MKNYSQAGQHDFVRLILGEDYVGTFLDIGCSGEQFSNTLALEREGWSGILVDIDDTAKGRTSKFIREDATKLKLDLPPYIDYLSLDIDFATLDALKNLPLKTTRFGIITIEDDQWRFGNQLREEEHIILRAHAYELICDDVCGTAGMPFESWWVSKELAPKAERLKCKGRLFSDIISA